MVQALSMLAMAGFLASLDADLAGGCSDFSGGVVRRIRGFSREALFRPVYPSETPWERPNVSEGYTPDEKEPTCGWNHERCLVRWATGVSRFFPSWKVRKHSAVPTAFQNLPRRKKPVRERPQILRTTPPKIPTKQKQQFTEKAVTESPAASGASHGDQAA